MDTEATYPHIAKINGRTAHLRRQPRVRVAQVVMDHLAHGWSVEEMCRQHTYLSPAEAHAAMLYYWDHQAEIHQEIQDEWKLADQEAAAASSMPIALRLRSA